MYLHPNREKKIEGFLLLDVVILLFFFFENSEDKSHGSQFDLLWLSCTYFPLVCFSFFFPSSRLRNASFYSLPDTGCLFPLVLLASVFRLSFVFWSLRFLRVSLSFLCPSFPSSCVAAAPEVQSKKEPPSAHAHLSISFSGRPLPQARRFFLLLLLFRSNEQAARRTTRLLRPMLLKEEFLLFFSVCDFYAKRAGDRQSTVKTPSVFLLV